MLKQPAVWRLASAVPHYTIAKKLQDFLLDSGSTTCRMQREYASQTQVNLIQQNWSYPYHQEAQKLKIPLRHHALIRETYLSCQNKVWMYAKAVFPPYFFRGKNKHLLKKLDSRPLGKLLFRDHTIQRSEFELALLQPYHLEYAWAMQQQTFSSHFSNLWARRSSITLHQKPLLLTEVFFPGFFDLVKVKS